MKFNISYYVPTNTPQSGKQKAKFSIQKVLAVNMFDFSMWLQKSSDIIYLLHKCLVGEMNTRFPYIEVLWEK